jgi:catechol 2,3-dioxygenase-like lactoylglutathione lyase family enzyme
MAELPVPTEGILLTHFIVSDDVERSRRFYTDVLGGETVYAATRPLSLWRRRGTRIGQAASSTSGLRTSRRYTTNGVRGGPSSSPRLSSMRARSAATSVIPTATSSRSAKALARSIHDVLRQPEISCRPSLRS